MKEIDVSNRSGLLKSHRRSRHTAIVVAGLAALVACAAASAQRTGTEAGPGAQAASTMTAGADAAGHCAALAADPSMPGKLQATYHPQGQSRAGGKPAGMPLAAHCVIRGELARPTLGSAAGAFILESSCACQMIGTAASSTSVAAATTG